MDFTDSWDRGSWNLYLRLSGLRLGLLINFGGELLKGNIERIVNGLDEARA